MTVQDIANSIAHVYMLMEHGTGHILAQIIMDKQMTTSSVTMEKKGSCQGLPTT